MKSLFLSTLAVFFILFQTVHGESKSFPIKYLDNQGIFIEKFDLSFADSFAVIEMEIVAPENPYITEYECKTVQIITIEEESNKLGSFSVNKTAVPKVTDYCFEKMKTMLKTDFNKLLTFQDYRLYKMGFCFEEAIERYETTDSQTYTKLKLRIPVYNINHGINFVSINYLEGFHESSSSEVCSSINEKNVGYEKNGEIYFPFPNPECSSSRNRMYCFANRTNVDSMKPDKCLTSIHKGNIESIKQSCPLKCTAETYNSTKPVLMSADNILYISKFNNKEVKRICTDSTMNLSIQPPATGVIGMKMHCACELFYEGKLLWSSTRYFNGALVINCTNSNSESDAIFQYIPAQLGEQNSASNTTTNINWLTNHFILLLLLVTTYFSKS